MPLARDSDGKMKDEVSLFLHCCTIDELDCKHESIDCPYRPRKWKVTKLSKGVIRYNPLHYNTQPEECWYKRKGWP